MWNLIVPQSVEDFALAKKYEVERLRQEAQKYRQTTKFPSRSPDHRVDILMRVAIRPKFYIDISFVRGLG